MQKTEEMIDALADAFSMGAACPKSIYIEALKSLTRLAVSEHEAAPLLAAQRDLQRVAEIYAASRSRK